MNNKLTEEFTALQVIDNFNDLQEKNYKYLTKSLLELLNKTGVSNENSITFADIESILKDLDHTDCSLEQKQNYVLNVLFMLNVILGIYRELLITSNVEINGRTWEPISTNGLRQNEWRLYYPTINFRLSPMAARKMSRFRINFRWFDIDTDIKADYMNITDFKSLRIIWSLNELSEYGGNVAVSHINNMFIINLKQQILNYSIDNGL